MVAHPQRQVVALPAAPAPAAPARDGRRQGLMVGDAPVDDFVVSAPDEVGQARGHRSPLAGEVAGVDRAPEQPGHGPGPALAVEFHQRPELPEIVGKAHGVRRPRYLEIRLPVVVNGDPGRLRHHVAAARADAEVAQAQRAGDVQPAEAPLDPDARLVHVLHRRLGNQFADLPGKLRELPGAAPDDRRDRPLRQLEPEQVAQQLHLPLAGDELDRIEVQHQRPGIQAVLGRRVHALRKPGDGNLAAGAAPAPVHPVLNHLGRNRLGDVVDLPGGMHLGIPRIKPPAAAGADLGTVMLDPVRRPRTSERRAGMALLAARAAIGPAAGIVAGRGVRLRQAVARRRLAAVGAVKASARTRSAIRGSDSAN